METLVDEKSLTHLALQSSFRVISEDIKLIRTASKEVKVNEMIEFCSNDHLTCQGGRTRNNKYASASETAET